MKSWIFFLFLSSTSFVFAQPLVIKGKAIDAVTGKGIAAMHIVENGARGTITNADGDFVVRVKEKSILTFSHIGYETKSIRTTISANALVLQFNPRTENLNEVVVTSKAITARDIMSKVFDNLKKNHAVEPVFYTFYNRVVNCSVGDSTLHILEEHVGTIKQNKLQFSSYNFEKSRVKAFSEKGNSELESWRVISMAKMTSDNMFKYREDYLKKGRSKKYDFELVSRDTLLGRNCYQIKFKTDESTYYKQGTLYIDTEDYAVVKKTLEKNDGTIINTINYAKINGQWYLKSAVNLHSGDNLEFNLRITLYNTTDKTEGDYITLTSRDFSIEFASDFSDAFWENYSYIPLPEWIRFQMN